MEDLDYSVVVEWDNSLVTHAGRPLRAVERFVDQMRAQPGRGELLVVYAESAVDGEALRRQLEPLTKDVELRLVPTPDCTYYQLKNVGVSQTRGRVVAFLDSDVLIAEGCLAALLAAVEEEGLAIVAGHTAPDTETLIDRTFAVTWSFPLRPPRPTRSPIGTFHVSCAAAPRALLLRFPFDIERVRSREACVDVARRLREAGIPILCEPRALARHPRPQPFASRALMEGRDRVLGLRATRVPLRAFLRLCSRYAKRTIGGNLRLWRDRRAAGLTALEVPAAWVINTTYFLLCWASGVATLLRPGLVAASLAERARAREARVAGDGVPHVS